MNKTLIFPVMILVLLLNLSIFDISTAYASNRVALVIGNSSYKSSSLDNPVNDATDIAKVLKRLGFDVILERNADKKTIVSALRLFGKKLAASKIGLFYYAGHGMQIDGTNYLIPVNNNIKEESEVEFEAIDAGRILAKMKTVGNSMNIVILDACRDNPFKRSFRSSKKGLAKMDAPPGTIIAYATSPGSVAEDGQGRNGTYTAFLLKNLETPGLDVQKMFNKTGLDVMDKTSKTQVPWVSTTPFPDYYLAGGTANTKANLHIELEKKVVLSPRAGQIWTEAVTGMEFVWVPKGCYQMGQTEAERQYLIKEVGKERYNKYFQRELPRHEVCVDGFWMAKTEVTRGQFEQFIKEKGYRTDADKKGTARIRNKETDWKWKEKAGYNWEKPGYSQAKDHPVSCVSWNDAKAFLNWLSRKTGQKFALPTEAQWEYAVRGGTNTMRFWGGDDSDACKYANVADKGYWTPSCPCDDGYKFTAPVGTFRANPFGIYDMLGNVWEWCEDVFDANAYSRHLRNNPLIISGGFSRVSRGGGWNNYSHQNVRAARRNVDLADFSVSFVGFRLCLAQVRQ